jgi:hypothetical protein
MANSHPLLLMERLILDIGLVLSDMIKARGRAVCSDGATEEYNFDLRSGLRR